ncbi:MAG TPA: MotA/TolQ/ExbB proton channel family protein, partial [Phycisphaerales bacterium]|nr:MotA/TolQ/ExbB proton channel family protein [Phycisphaerales bacterium]
LNVIGNLGPLVGLAGTVWGMILAFTSLGDSGGQAGPSDLSLGISKALFHTLLGLCLAIPCLFVFGLYRSIVDRICTRGTVLCGRVVEQLPDQGDPPRA